MTDADLLRNLNLALSWMDLALLLTMLFVIRRYLMGGDPSTGVPARLHARTAMAALALFALLGTVTSTSNFIFGLGDPSLDWIRFVAHISAVALRVGAFILLLAWMAVVMERTYRDRFPHVERWLTAMLHFRRPGKED